MARILIVDDDEHFKSLLKDIFTQSGFDVETIGDPEDAFAMFESRPFDLIVSDQKMPGLSGEQLVRKVKQLRPDVPVIIVSGYLEANAIRSFIREGVGGVFMKPLNVFALLKRAQALLEQRARDEALAVSAEGGARDAEDFAHSLPFAFSAFPAMAARSKEFARKLHLLRNFKLNLVLLGEKGSDVEAILADLMAFETGEREHFGRLNAVNLDAAAMMAIVSEARQQGATRLTLVIPYPERLNADQQQLILAASRNHAPFEDLAIPVRYLFYVNREIDTLYDDREIDDDLYMFMGTTELRIPNLREIRDDIPILAFRILRTEARKHRLPITPTLTMSAKIFLREKDWPGNLMELRNFCRELIETGESELSREDVEAVERRLSLSKSTFGEVPLYGELEQWREDYCRAVVRLAKNRTGRASRLLAVAPETLEGILGLQPQAADALDAGDPTGTDSLHDEETYDIGLGDDDDDLSMGMGNAF